MLCMNCQQDTNGGNVNGIDAGNGAYYKYLDGCGSGTNQSLPVAIQTAVCNEGIKLDNFLYNLFWNTGACTYTREAAEQEQVSDDNNTTTRCPDSSGSTTASLTIPTASTPALSPTLSSSTPVQSITESPDGVQPTSHTSSTTSSTLVSSKASTSMRRIAALKLAVQGRSSGQQTGENGARLSLAQADSNDNPLDVDTAELVPYVTVTQSALPIGDGPTLTHLPSTRSRVTCPPSRGAPPTYYSCEPSERAPPTYHSHES
ncbi:hypothetical protein IEO21_10570 [Rhodonia placenta]|uniref:Uncharacterized protein n=1 Tax=Rhodonia placenta TaxID=104341 RepID=A0A8H7TWL4_9APHY|nr:hypothetical protein IEO21_10570 [Postia placenta]